MQTEQTLPVPPTPTAARCREDDDDDDDGASPSAAASPALVGTIISTGLPLLYVSGLPCTPGAATFAVAAGAPLETGAPVTFDFFTCVRPARGLTVNGVIPMDDRRNFGS